MSFFDAITDTVSKAADVVSSTASAIADGVANVVSKARDAANKAVDWVVDKARQVGEAISDAVAWIFDKAKAAFTAAKAAAVKAICMANQAVIAAKKAAGSGDPIYDTPEEAAKAALKKANPQSIKDNLEYGGMIYKDKNGKYGFTGPAKGTDAGFNPSDAPVPAGTSAAGDYHTHADYSVKDPKTGKAVRTSDPKKDSYNSDNFSQTDKTGITSDAAGKPGYKGYLGTPSGKFKQYDPATNTVSDL